jgi:hypothetical protein
MQLILFYIFVFLVGFIFCLTSDRLVTYETFDQEDNCPNLLIKRGNKYLLQNTKKVIVPGVNPIVFNNLSEYEEFINWQKSQNIKCPVLYLEYAYNTQGHPVHFVSPNPPFSGTDTIPEFTPSFKNELCNSK